MDEQIQPGSRCPISTLSPRQLKMRYENMRRESSIALRRTCTSLHQKLEILSNVEDEEVLEKQDPNGYTLVQKVLKFINNDSNGVYKAIFTAVMENMCGSNKECKKVLTDDERKQCSEIASVILEQMQSNAKKLQRKKKVCGFLHGSYEWHSPSTQDPKLDTKRCAKPPLKSCHHQQHSII